MMARAMMALLLLACAAAHASAATAPAACVAMSCCALSADELRACSSISTKCPGYTGIGALGPDGECDECPPGECRVGNNCVCPADFLASDRKGGLQRMCSESHGAAWPASTSRRDKLCDSLRPSPSPGTSPTPGASPISSPTPGASASPGATHGHLLSPSGVFLYIQKKASQGTNILGIVSTFILCISIIVVCCACYTRRRR